MSDKSPSPGFTLLQSSDIPEYRARGIWLTHNATGCQVYHLLAEDEENFFSFCFKTPSFNNRGAAHIVEHAVLSGSENYPVKDPFIQLLKGSMHTFLNAMTYPDKTIYPAASTLAKDLFNVMAVYGDAVFFPLLRREVFWQEGHRIQLGPENRAGITGVVYNEMKGNYANHDSIAAEWSYRSLFPDTPYAFDAGGDPEVIPDLTYEEFLTFHRTYYHPSNCRIFLYGNIPTETYLTFLEERFLGVFGKIPLSSDIPDQPAWKAPAVLEKTCHLGAEESPRGKTTITLNWLLGHAFEPSKALEMEIIAEILIGNPGAVLYKALVESGLGQDLSPVSGLDMHTRQMVFTIGLRGTDPEKQQDFENLVMETLRNLADKGIPQEMLEGVLRRVEFQNREIKGGIPFGLRLCGRVLQGWMHNESPEKTLLFETYMEELKKKVSAAGRYLEGLIDSWLTANVHRTTVLVRPDPLHGQNETEKLERRLENLEKSLTPEKRNQLGQENRLLSLFQENPDNPEDSAKIPVLELSDLPKDVDIISGTLVTSGKAPVYIHELFTNGVMYADFGFSLAALEDRYFDYLPLFCKAVISSGLPGMKYDEVSRLLVLLTGGFSAYLETGGIAAAGKNVKPYLFFRLKMLKTTLTEAFSLIRRLLTETDFADTKRLKDLLLEMRNDYKSSVLPRGSFLAALRAGSRISLPMFYDERWKGISQLLHLEGMTSSVEAGDLDALRIILNTIKNAVLDASLLSVNITVEPENRLPVLREVENLVSSLPDTGTGTAGAGSPFFEDRRLPDGPFEPLIIPGGVGFAGCAFPGAFLGTDDHGLETVLAHLLATGFLWEQVRMKGGAYGASAYANGTEGVFSFSSYRDPDITETIRIFRESLEFAASGKIEDDTVVKAIIGSVGKDIKPLAPGIKGFLGYRRNLYGISDGLRQQRRDAMLSCTAAGIAQSAGRLLEQLASGSYTLLGGAEAIQKAVDRLNIKRAPLKLPV